MRGKKLIIVATTNIIADSVRSIAGDAAVVYGLMGCGVDPHLYRARESDVHKLAAADIVFYHGLHLEGKMGLVLQGMHRFTHTVAVADVLDKSLLRETEFVGMYDPHVWFDVQLWITVVRHIQAKMIELDPDHSDMYKKNGDAYIKKLEFLHQYIQAKMFSVAREKRVLVTAHDAFGYFGRAYECEVVGLQGLSTDSDISTKDIQGLASYIVAKRVKTVFVESSIPQRALVAVQKAVESRGWSVAIGDELYSDSLGDDLSAASSYYDMMIHNVDIIVNSLVD